MVIIDREEFFLLRGKCITSCVTFDFEELAFGEVSDVFLFLSPIIMEQNELVC